MFSRAPTLPSTVIEVDSSNYDAKIVVDRENGLLLYGTLTSNGVTDFDIIQPLPISRSITHAFSLHRTNERGDAERHFNSFKRTVPIFCTLTKTINTQTLQEICDLLRTNGDWTIAHLAVHMSKSPFLQHSDVIKHLNSVSEDGLTPIMLAVKNNNLALVKDLIKLKSSLNYLTPNGDCVLHLAAERDNTILTLLLKEPEGIQWIDKCNNDGMTPLFIACKNNKTDCIESLILHGAKIEMNRYPNPMYYCTSVETINFFQKYGVNINCRDEKGQTPLYMMVQKNDYECVLHLLQKMADPCESDEDCVTPLHIAVINSNADMIKALIAFGANVNVRNKNGESPRHLIDLNKTDASKIIHILHAVGAERCPPNFPGCRDLCAYGGTNDGPPSAILINFEFNPLEQLFNITAMERIANENRKIRGGRILCLDGGGIRGLVLIQILKELETMAGRSLIKCFDWVAGTSTGGILALALASGKTLQECQSLYFSLKDKVFCGSRPYSSDVLEGIFREYFGNLTMRDIKHPKLMITTVLCDECPLRLEIMRNYASSRSVMQNRNTVDNIDDTLLWKVARMTSAAPTFFPPYEYYIDGGLIANNPTLDALTEVFEYGLALRTIEHGNKPIPHSSIVVSCGTGMVPVKKINAQIYHFLKRKFSEYGLINTMMSFLSVFKQIGNIITELITCTDGRYVDRARAWCSMAGISYYRFNPPLTFDVELDEVKDDIIVHTMWETKAYVHQNKVLAREMIDMLMRAELED